MALIAVTTKAAGEGLPENVSWVGCADEGSCDIEFHTELAIALVTKRHNVPFTVVGIGKLNMGTVLGWCEATYFVAVGCFQASGIFPVPNPATVSISFSKIVYCIYHLIEFYVSNAASMSSALRL